MDEIAINLRVHKISEESRWKGKTVVEFSPAPDELVIMIKRGDHIIIPKGDTVIEEDDTMVCNALAECKTPQTV